MLSLGALRSMKHTIQRNLGMGLNNTARSGDHSRHFFLEALARRSEKVGLELMKRNLQAEMSQGRKVNERTLVEYLKTMNRVNPRDAANTIERGWADKTMPLNENILKEYFTAVGELKRFDQINIRALLQLLNKENPAEAEATIAQFMQSGAGAGSGSGGGGAGMFGSAGSSSAAPLFVAQAGEKGRLGVKVFQSLISLFVFMAVASVVLDSQSGGGGIGGILGKSVVHQAETSDKTFDDVVGVDEAKHELEEIVAYLMDPSKFTRLGGKLPKGVLLTGSPGVGKTLLARAIAGEAGVPFFYTSGSEFEEMFVGVGASRVRKLFEEAKKKAPCIVFIDEVDAIGGKRNDKESSSMKMTLNQLLVEMDGFQQNEGIIIIAATNFPESLDKALTRPGRLDKVVDVPMPDVGGRKAILELYTKKVPLADDVRLEQIARGTPGFSGASLANLVNQAACEASRNNLDAVNMAAFEWAKDKIMMGAERKSAIISEETLRTTAWHEGGHALVALKTPHSNPVHKATIMPRGRALGMVMQMPDGDQTSMTRAQMLAYMDVCMGGRVAEELVFGYDAVTSGAVSDIQQATNVARSMVTKYGLSEKMGVMFLDDKDKLSGETQKMVDDEVRRLLTESYVRAQGILKENRKELDLIAEALLSYESLSGSELVNVTKGIQPDPIANKRSQLPSRVPKEIPTKTRGQLQKEKEQTLQDKAKAKDAGDTSSKKGYFASLLGGGGGGGSSAPAATAVVASPKLANATSATVSAVAKAKAAAEAAVPARNVPTPAVVAAPVAADSSSTQQQQQASAAHEQQKKRLINPILTKVVPSAAPKAAAGGVASTAHAETGAAGAATATTGTAKEAPVENAPEKTRGPPRGPPTR